MPIDLPIDFEDSLYDDAISGMDFAKGCNKKYKPSDVDFSFDTVIEPNDVWFIKRDFLPEFFYILPQGCPPITVVTQHSDYELDAHVMSRKPSCVKTVFAPNNTYVSSDSVPIPLGLGPRYGKGAPFAEDIKTKNTRSKRQKLLYVNFRPYTYEQERLPLWNHFVSSSFSWTTVANLDSDYNKYDVYLDQMTQHKFSLCPRGNGIDTHRLWESLYCRTIPIVKYCEANRNFLDLPILFVDDWKQITEHFLNEQYDRICNTKWNYSKLSASWWKTQFNST
jgi:hypothetical protein